MNSNRTDVQLSYIKSNIVKSHLKEESLNDDSAVLRRIILRELSIDIRTTARYTTVVDAKKIYASLMYERGHTLKSIGRSMGNTDHSTIIHYLKKIDDLISTEDAFRDKYILVKKYFMHEKPVQHVLPNDKIDTIHLQNTLGNLILEHSKLMEESLKYKRLQHIIDIIDAVTPEGQEFIMESKIKQMLKK